MRVAGYVRVSTDRQQQAQTIEQQVSLLRTYASTHADWVLHEEHIFGDDGYSGARLQRPGLDTLRDQVARAEFDVVVITAPDRLARHFVHQMVVLEEWERLLALDCLAHAPSSAVGPVRCLCGPGPC